jgi:transposase
MNENISRKEIASELDVSLKTIYKLIDLQITSPELTKKYRAELLEWREKFPNANRKQFQNWEKSKNCRDVLSYQYLYI